MNTPILFLIFSRPDTTAKVFEAIRAAQPKRLYIAADGPRESRGEKEATLCKETRDLVLNNIDWDCEVKTLLRDENLGCGLAVSGALKWFFENEPEGIVLEDDVLPHPDFFPYCEELLDKYRDNDDVYFIGGNNFDFYEKQTNDSYYFSAYNHVWGWAAWRKTWNIYNFTLDGMTLGSYFKAISKHGFTIKEKLFWCFIFMQMKLKSIDTWDYQLSLSLHYAKKLSIIPNVAMIKNLGFGEGATHTTGIDLELANRDYAPIMPLSHPSIVKRNKLYDARFIAERSYFMRLPLSIIKVWIKYILR